MRNNTGTTRAFSGFTMLAVAAIVLVFSGSAQTYGFSAFIDPLINEFGWSRSRISLGYSIATLVCAIPALYVGRQIDRVGSRKTMAIAAALYGLSLIFLSQVNTFLTLVVAFTLVRATGFAALSLGARTLVPQWFVRRRGLAFSLLGLAASASFAILPRLNTWLIESIGWRSSWLILGFIMLLGLTPLIAIVVRNRPEDIGQFPDGLPPEEPAKYSAQADSSVEWTLKQAIRTKVFWILLLGGTVPSVTGTGMSLHFMSIMSERGLTIEFAATLFAIESLVSLPMSFLSGWIVDRHPARYVQAASQVLAAVALIVLVFAAGTTAALGFAIIRGMSGGLWGVAADVVWPTYFGRRNIGSIRSITMVGTVVGAAFGPIILGLVYDSSGSYAPGLIAFAVLPAIAAIAMRWATPPSGSPQ